VQRLKLQSALERNMLQAKSLAKKISGESALFGASISHGVHHHHHH